MREWGCMYENFARAEILFKTDEQEAREFNEQQLIACCVIENCLEIVRVSEGVITQYCFDTQTYSVLTTLDAQGTQELAGYFHVFDIQDLPKILATTFDGIDADINIRDVCAQLSIPVEVSEHIH